MADISIITPGSEDDCAGERGERGERGKRGHRGHRGHDGGDGLTGPTGSTGGSSTGSTGSTGPTGPTGSGSTGSTGPAGAGGGPVTTDNETVTGDGTPGFPITRRGVRSLFNLTQGQEVGFSGPGPAGAQLGLDGESLQWLIPASNGALIGGIDNGSFGGLDQGDMIYIQNCHPSFSMGLVHEDPTRPAALRIVCPSGVNYVLPPMSGCVLIYGGAGLSFNPLRWVVNAK